MVDVADKDPPLTSNNTPTVVATAGTKRAPSLLSKVRRTITAWTKVATNTPKDS